MKYSTAPLYVLLACLLLAPQLSSAQGCEWERFAEPSVDIAFIEVLRSGGFGPRAGRTLVSLDASGRIALLPRGRCPDRTLVGSLPTPTFDDLARELERALVSVRSQPPRPFVSPEHPLAEILREGRMEPLCQSLADGEDVDVTLYRNGAKEQYRCVTGELLRFGERVLRLVSDSICAGRVDIMCIERDSLR